MRSGGGDPGTFWVIVLVEFDSIIGLFSFLRISGA